MTRPRARVRAIRLRTARPPASAAALPRLMPPPLLALRTTEASTVTMPALPSSTSHRTIRRRTGWLTTVSASLVVKPTPKNALRAWKRATSRERPVCCSAEVPTRVMSRLTETVTRTAMTAATVWLFPDGRADIGDEGVDVVVPRGAEWGPAGADGGAVAAHRGLRRVRLAVHLEEEPVGGPHEVGLDELPVEFEEAVDDRFGKA